MVRACVRDHYQSACSMRCDTVNLTDSCDCDNGISCYEGYYELTPESLGNIDTFCSVALTFVHRNMCDVRSGHVPGSSWWVFIYPLEMALCIPYEHYNHALACRHVIDQSICKFCPRGQYANGVASRYCSLCAPGMYQPFTGTPACHSCVAGKYQPARGQTICLDAKYADTHLKMIILTNF